MATPSFDLDQSVDSPSLDFLKWIRQARQSGKSLPSMLKEIVKLRRGMGRLQPDEYFMYGLYDDRRFSPDAKATFLGQNNLLVRSPWAKISKDKPNLTALLRGLDLPVPETQAIVHPTRSVPGAIALRDCQSVQRFLRDEARYPIFGKPFDSGCSIGTVKINGYDADQNSVIVAGDRHVAVDTLAEKILSWGQKYLFQTLLLPHPEIVQRIGPCVSSVRMFVISDDDGVWLTRAAWKIPASENDADNFWRNGNLLAAVDVETGKIGRTLVRTEAGTEPIERHPKTGVAFDGMTFPQWDQMRETVLEAARQIPSCPFQGWDVALTDRGPVLVELEGDGGNPVMEQLCFDTGLLQGRYLDVVEKQRQEERRSRTELKSQDNRLLKQSITALAKPRTEKADAKTSDDRPAKAQTSEAADTAPGDEATTTVQAPIVTPGQPAAPTDSPSSPV